jgi:hypothetical protein
MFQPDAKNVERCVDVPIVGRSAVATLPAPYSKRAHTFRTAVGNGPAARARLGTVSFVRFDKHGSVPSGLVAEHVSEIRPAGVEHGLSHPCLSQAGGVHIADDDQTILPNDPGGLFVKVVTASVRYLGMDSSNSLLVSRPLGNSQTSFILPVVLERRHLATVAQRCEILQAKVDANSAIASGEIIGHLALKDDIPAPARVLGETSATILALDVAAFPKLVSTLEVNNSATV